ncbi:peptidase domain-containing ABC transporter [Serratia bockelmannii]
MKNENESYSDFSYQNDFSEIENKWDNKLKFSTRKKVPVILQTEAAECGLACVAMISEYFGHGIDMISFRAKNPVTMRGMTLLDVMNAAATLKLITRPIKLELEYLSKISMPCILHWNMNHFVVLTEVRSGNLYINDPGSGKRVVSINEANESFTGIALELAKGARFERKEKRPTVSLRALSGGITGVAKGLSQIFLLALLLELLTLLAPLLVQTIVDQVLADSDYDLLVFLGVSFALVLVLKIVIEAARSWIVIWLSTKFNLAWTGNAFSHLLRLPLDYFSRRYLGDIISRFGAINVIQQTLTTSFVVVVIDGIFAILTTIMLFSYSPKLAVITVLFAFVYAISRVIYYQAYSQANLQQINVVAVQQGALIESLRMINTLKLNNKILQRSVKYMNSTTDMLNASVRVQKLNLVFNVINLTVIGTQRITVLWLGAWLALQGNLTSGMLVAFVAYADQFISRFIGLVDYLVQFRLLRLQGERLADIMLSTEELHVEGSFLGPLSHFGIDFSAVSFNYSQGGGKVLDNCSFKINHGEIVAITGPSGSGKSTIAKLFLGVHDYQSGEISVGGVEMRALGKRRIRNLAASVLQDDHLLSGTIFENITFFDENANSENVFEAARKAGIDREIEAMPMGYQTSTGDMGASLSGGQQQRILLARALYRKPKILILDEATSHLDLDNEAKICDSVRSTGATTLIIAHRPQTILSADRVLLLENGVIKEISRHQNQVMNDERATAT